MLYITIKHVILYIDIKLFLKIYERNLKNLQFTTQRFDTPV